MKKDKTLEEKLAASLKKIDSVFFRMHKNKLSLREGKGMSDKTTETYKNMMKSLMKDIFKSTGKADITRVREEDILAELEKRVQKYKDGAQKESYNIKTIRSAVKAFVFGAVETKVFKRKMNFNGKQVDQMIKNEKIIRKASFSTNLKATPEECEKVIQNIETEGYRTQTKRIAADVLRMAQYSGARVSAALNLKPENIVENNDGSVSVWFINDKGGLDHKTNVYDQDHVQFFKELKAKGHLGREILKARRSDGTFKGTEATRKEVSKIIEKHSGDFKKIVSVRHRENGVRVTKRVEVKFTTHSGRKAFANERAKMYWNLLKHKTVKEILREQHPEEYKKVMEKYQKEVVKKVNLYNNRKRDLTREEQAIFLTSIDTGHFRNNVLKQYYLDLSRFRKYQKENM